MTFIWYELDWPIRSCQDHNGRSHSDINWGRRSNEIIRLCLNIFWLFFYPYLTNSLLIYDLITTSGAYFLALLLRFDFRFSMIDPIYLIAWERFAPFYAVYCVIIFWALRLYKSLWRFASFTELERITVATLITTVVHAIVITLMEAMASGLAVACSGIRGNMDLIDDCLFEPTNVAEIGAFPGSRKHSMTSSSSSSSCIVYLEYRCPSSILLLM